MSVRSSRCILFLHCSVWQPGTPDQRPNLPGISHTPRTKERKTEPSQCCWRLHAEGSTRGAGLLASQLAESTFCRRPAEIWNVSSEHVERPYSAVSAPQHACP